MHKFIRMFAYSYRMVLIDDGNREECFENDETFRIINDHTIEIDAKKCRRSLDDYDEDEFYFF